MNEPIVRIRNNYRTHNQKQNKTLTNFMFIHRLLSFLLQFPFIAFQEILIPLPKKFSFLSVMPQTTLTSQKRYCGFPQKRIFFVQNWHFWFVSGHFDWLKWVVVTIGCKKWTAIVFMNNVTCNCIKINSPSNLHNK